MLRTRSLVYPLSTTHSSSRDSGQHFLQLSSVLHHLFHLSEFLKKRIHFGHRSSAATSDALSSSRIQNIRAFAFAGSHGKHDSLNSFELLFVDRKVFHITHPRQHAKDIFEGPEASKHLKLSQEVVEIEIGGPDFLFKLCGFFFVNCLRRPLNQADHITHPQDSPREPFGKKWFELVDLLTNSGKLDRALRHFPHGERSTTARVSVEFRQDQASQLERTLKMCRDAHRLLASRRVADKKNFLRAQEIREPLQFTDQNLVYLKATGRIKNLNVPVLRFRPGQSILPNLLQVGFATFRLEDGHTNLCP